MVLTRTPHQGDSPKVEFAHWDHLGEPKVAPRLGQGIQIGRPDGKSAISGNVLHGVYLIHSSAVAWADPSERIPAAQVLAGSRYHGDHAEVMKAVKGSAEGYASPYAHWRRCPTSISAAEPNDQVTGIVGARLTATYGPPGHLPAGVRIPVNAPEESGQDRGHRRSLEG